MARTQGDYDAKRVEIAKAACKAILRLGLGGTGLADIAREMGYTTGVLRHYFENKDELLLFTKNLFFDRAYKCARDAGQAYEGIERLRVMALELLPRDSASIDRWRLLAAFNGRAIGDPELMKRQHNRNGLFWALFSGEIVALQKSGMLPSGLDPELEACGIVGFIDGLADQVIMKPSSWPYAALAALMNRYIDGLLQLQFVMPASARSSSRRREK